MSLVGYAAIACVDSKPHTGSNIQCFQPLTAHLTVALLPSYMTSPRAIEAQDEGYGLLWDIFHLQSSTRLTHTGKASKELADLILRALAQSAQANERTLGRREVEIDRDRGPRG